MPFSTIDGKNVPIKLWAPLDEVDAPVLRQLKSTPQTAGGDAENTLGC